jgi:hypothetical protein
VELPLHFVIVSTRIDVPAAKQTSSAGPKPELSSPLPLL